MNVLAFAGFLGSGKTTVIKNCINSMLRQGLKIAIIENEIGTTSIDDAILNEGGIEITTLTNGCVCCSISGSLISAAIQIEREINPDWLIVELTGLAYMTGIRDLFAERGKQFKLYSVTVIDIARWMKLLKITRPLLIDQVSGANVILINKTDITEPTEEEIEEISRLASGSPVIRASAQNDGEQLWDEISARLKKPEAM
jgi:G3E family GTPase